MKGQQTGPTGGKPPGIFLSELRATQVSVPFRGVVLVWCVELVIKTDVTEIWRHTEVTAHRNLLSERARKYESTEVGVQTLCETQ